MQPADVIRLSVGAGRSFKIFVVVAATALTAILGASVLALAFSGSNAADSLTGGADKTPLPGDLGGQPAGPAVPDTGGSPPVGALALVSGGLFASVMCSVLVVLVAGYLVLRILRAAAWLSGSRLYVRGGVLTRSADLSAADISVGGVAHRQHRPIGSWHNATTIYQVPTIVATDRISCQAVTLPMRGHGLAALPAPELRALAGAMTDSRPGGLRDDGTTAIADWLRRLADDPFARTCRAADLAAVRS